MSIAQPTEIDCLSVDKIYDVKTKSILLNGAGSAPILCTAVTSAICGTPACAYLSAIVGPDNMNTLSWLVTVPVQVTCQNGATTTVNAQAQVVATICNPPGTAPACALLDVKCSAGIEGGIIYATVTATAVLTTSTRVSLLVPSYGYCVPTACPHPQLPCPPPPPQCA